jgi:hypothetical protein
MKDTYESSVVDPDPKLFRVQIYRWRAPINDKGTPVMLQVPLCSDEGRRRRRGKGWTPLAASPAYINIRFSELGPTQETV